MKLKKVLVSISSIIICCSLFIGNFGITVSAASPLTKDDPNWSYVNDNGIEINEEQYKNLISQGFEPIDIQIMSQEAFDLNKDIQATEVSETVKYIKTTAVYDKGTVASSSAQPTTFVNTELTEEEANKEVKEFKKLQSQGGISTFGTETGVDSTSYKKLTVTISKLSTGRYRSNTTLNWLTIPKTRKMDVIGASIRYPDFWNVDHSKRGGTQYYKSDAYDSYGNYFPNYDSDTIQYSASSGNWVNNSFSGAALVQNLKDDYKYGGKYCNLVNLRHNSWFDFTFANKNYDYSTVNIKGAFTHQITSEVISIDGFTFEYGKVPSIQFKMGNKGDSYDNELNAIAYINK